MIISNILEINLCLNVQIEGDNDVVFSHFTDVLFVVVAALFFFSLIMIFAYYPFHGPQVSIFMVLDKWLDICMLSTKALKS